MWCSCSVVTRCAAVVAALRRDWDRIMMLSVLMPVYNEVATLPAAVKDVLEVDYPCEIEVVIVDDGSTDGTRDLYAAFESDPRVSVHLHPANQGKGAAIRTAARAATGEYVIICDADLEYSPREIPAVLQ